MIFNENSESTIRQKGLKKGGLGYLGFGLLASILMSGYLSTANAVVFFKDNFERTSLNKTTGLANGQIQDAVAPSQWDYFNTTRVWTAGANNLEVQANGTNGFNANSGRYRVELDTTVNSTMSTKLNLVNGQGYRLRFFYRSIPRTVTTTTRVCTLIIFCQNVTTTTTTFVGGGVRAAITSPGFSSGFITVGDVANWTEAVHTFTWTGATGEATLTFEATGPSDAFGTSIDDVAVETTIAGAPLAADGGAGGAEALTGILPPPVRGLVSNDTTRTDIVTPIVVDKQAAIALGKALFWDQGVGSDQMACASCHFNVGVDNRIKNQVNPGLNHPVASGSTFETTLTGVKSGPNYTLKKEDFPFNPNNNDVVSSSGTFSGTYQTSPGATNNDECARAVGGLFHVNGVGTRNVEPRHTPTTVNAAYNFRNFWDGRANNVFNGVTPFGLRDTANGVIINTASGLVKRSLKLENASLASQAVGPVGSDFEMACRGRQFADVGRKLLNRKPLSLQTISATDSVLSALPALIGTSGTYANLIQKAFAPAYWNGACGTACGTPGTGVTPGAAYTQMEANFSMYFGIAVQMYEETLKSDDSKFDRWKRGHVAPTASEANGEAIFNGKGGCIACHGGPVMSNAARFQLNENLIESMLMRNGRVAIYDVGYYNLGVVPTAFDNGGDGTDPFGNTLTFTKQYISNRFVDNFGVEPCLFDVENGLCNDSSAARRALQNSAVTGTFKVPTLRNVSLTGPYMHNGALLTLEQVVDFYDRGGNVDNFDKSPDIFPIGLTAQEKIDLVNFMKTFTDDRVAFERAPFDHPSLTIPNGHTGDQNAVTSGNTLLAALGKDDVLTLPAVGSAGTTSPVKPFDQLLPSIWKQVGTSAGSIAAGSDGSVLIINSANNGIWKYNADNNWSSLPGKFGFAVAVVNVNRSFHVGNFNTLWQTNIDGGFWNQVGSNAKAIAASSDGMVLGTTASNTIWTYNSNTNQYVNLPGQAKAVAIVNANTLFCIGMSDAVFRYNGSAWVQVGVSAGSISAGSDGTVLVTNINDNSIWKYVADNNWVRIPGTLKSVAVIGNNRYFGIGTDGNVYRN